MRNIIFLLVFLPSCMSKSKLAKECNKYFPVVEKETVVISQKIDTVYEYQPLPPLPLIGIRCFQFEGKESKEIFSVPCTCLNKTTIVEKTKTVADTAKMFILSEQLAALRKDSLKTAKLVFELKTSTDKKAYFYKTGFFVCLGLIILLAAFLIYRLTRKVA